ncbi:MAG: type I-MYXAN CRISPR-associated protein Cas6/Cmx6 [Gammaproteobacteria bacterium]|nr:MAG: type I-MYXAN CRISPR-associated protein Cas6/Cmx6 [Gammaproteobacteria bacterium]
MLWVEEDDQQEFELPDDIVDVSYKIECRQIAIDHAHDLSMALLQALPWLAEEADAGVHLIHGASSGNGWQRPDENSTDDFIYLSKRARMQLRVPKQRIEDAHKLTGQVLQVGDYAVEVGEAQIRPLTTLGTLFARYIPILEGEGEEAFLERIVSEMRAMDVKVKKVLCGVGHTFSLPEGRVETLSVMVADLDPRSSVKLQQKGIGEGRKRGFGLFIPHKGIKPVGDMSEKSHFSGT